MRRPAKEGYRVIAESGDSNVAGYPKTFYAAQYKGGLSEALRFAREEYRRALSFVQNNTDEHGLKVVILKSLNGEILLRENIPPKDKGVKNGKTDNNNTADIDRRHNIRKTLQGHRLPVFWRQILRERRTAELRHA